MDEGFYRGDESRLFMDNNFRASRRRTELAAVLAKRRTPLPEAGNRYRDRDTATLVTGFTNWHV